MVGKEAGWAYANKYHSLVMSRLGIGRFLADVSDQLYRRAAGWGGEISSIVLPLIFKTFFDIVFFKNKNTKVSREKYK